MHHRLRLLGCFVLTVLALVACNRSAPQAQVQPTLVRPTNTAKSTVPTSATPLNTVLPSPSPIAATAATEAVAVEASTPISATSENWTTQTIGENTLSLPPNWQTVPLNKADLEQFAAAFESQNSELAQLVRGLVASGQYQQIQFFAIDTKAGDSAANVSIASVARPASVTPDALMKQVMSSLASTVPGIKILTGDAKYQVNGLPAGRLVYDVPLKIGTTEKQIRGVQWQIVGPTKVYIITLSGPSNDEFVALADKVGHSFRTTESADSANTERRQVINGGNLRQAAKIVASNVIGQVCPGDQVALLDSTTVTGWAKIRVVTTGPDCDPKRVTAGSEGWLSTSLLGPVAEGNAADLPPSLLVSKLVPFTHQGSGISGVRPDNWTVFSFEKSFQVSSSPEAPDGFIGRLIAPDTYPAGGAMAASRTLLDSLKKNQAEGPAPEIIVDSLSADGSGTLLAHVSGLAQGSTKPVRSTIYARTTATSKGILVAIAIVPTDPFPKEETLIRQMVDSLQVTGS